MKSEKSASLRYDYRLVFHSPYAFHYIGAFFALISVVIAAFLPPDNFLIAPGILGDKWGLMGLIIILVVIGAINLAVSNLIISRDRVLFWVLSAASAAVSVGVLVKVASVAYFW